MPTVGKRESGIEKLAKVTSTAGSGDPCSPLNWLGDVANDVTTLWTDNRRQKGSPHARRKSLYVYFKINAVYVYFPKIGAIT